MIPRPRSIIMPLSLCRACWALLILVRSLVSPSACWAVQAFRGFAGTSILILVGVATDTARRVKAEQAMQRYKDYDNLYDDV